MTPPPARKFSGIFISYRREDSAGHAGRLYDRLFAHFGPEHVFMDIDRIEPGEDFVQVIETAVGSCDVVLVVIGRRWLAAGEGNARRLDNPQDFVRLEIATALKRNVRVIPVLVADATMPGEQDLPAELSGLSRRNAVELSDARWNRDVQQFIQVLDKFLAKLEAERREASEADERRQRAAEDEAQRRQQEEARRQQEENQRRHEQARVAQSAEEERRRRDAEAQRTQAQEAARRRDEAERQRARGSATATGSVTPVPDGLASEWKSPAAVKSKRAPRAAIIVAAVLGLLIFVALALTAKQGREPRVDIAPDANSQATAREMSTTTSASLRSGPNAKSTLLGVVPPGARVRVLQTSGDWAEVEVVLPPVNKGVATRGWVYTDFLR